jgi:hypothetical protein
VTEWLRGSRAARALRGAERLRGSGSRTRGGRDRRAAAAGRVIESFLLTRFLSAPRRCPR